MKLDKLKIGQSVVTADYLDKAKVSALIKDYNAYVKEEEMPDEKLNAAKVNKAIENKTLEVLDDVVNMLMNIDSDREKKHKKTIEAIEDLFTSLGG